MHAALLVALLNTPLRARDSSPHTVRRVTVEEGVRLEVLDWGGSGRPVVLLGGYGNNAHVFDQFAPRLAAELTNLALRYPPRIGGLVYLDAADDRSKAGKMSSEQLVRQSKRLRNPDIWLEITRSITKPDYAHVQVPALAFFAVSPLDFEVQTGMPSARVVVLQNADHYVYRSNEADVLRKMRAFLVSLK